MEKNIFENKDEIVISEKMKFKSSGSITLQPGRYCFVAKYKILDVSKNQSSGNKPLSLDETPKQPNEKPFQTLKRKAKNFVKSRPRLFRFVNYFRQGLKNTELIEIMIANWKIPKTYRSLVISAEKNSVKQNKQEMTFLEFKLDKATELEFRCTLLGSGKVAVNEIKIFKKENILPDNPAVLFILEDRKDPTGCVHQGISSIAAYLKKHGINSHAIITSTCDDKFIKSKLRLHKYKYIAFSILTGIEGGKEVYSVNTLDRIKKILPSAKIVVGGPHVSIVESQILEENKNIDIGVIREGEQTMYEIVSGKPLVSIDGITYRHNKSIIKNKTRKFFKSLDHLPIPLRDIYFNDDWDVHCILTSRGCPYKCHFCSSSRIFGQILRFKPIEQIDQEMQWLYENADHSKLVVINDDMFNLRKDRTLELMKIFKKYPFKFYARGCRADNIDAEVAKAMKEAGITGCGIGIESADNESLRKMLKSQTIEEIERGINHLKANGIFVAGQFIIGNIGDTLETVKKSIEFGKKCDSARFYSACLYPGTPLTEYVLSNNYQLEKPFNVYKDSPSTQIFFETPIFPLKDRIEAIKLAYEAGFIAKFPEKKKENQK